MSNRRPLSSLLLLLWLGTGCATAVPRREPPGPDARRALDLLASRWAEFSDLRTRVEIVVEKSGERRRFEGVLLAKAPGSLRFEALSAFGQPFLYLTVHDGRFTAYDATTDEALVGPATAETAARILRVSLAPDDLVAVVAGRALPPKDLRTAEVLPPDEHGPSLELVGGSYRQRVWMDLETGVVRQVTIREGWTEARITYRRDGAGVLTGLDLRVGDADLAGSVTYRNGIFGGGIDQARFAFTPPNSAKIRAVR